MRFLAKPKRASSLWSYGLTKSFHIFCVEFYIFYCLLQRYIKKIEYLRPVTQEKIKSKTIFVKRRLRTLSRVYQFSSPWLHSAVSMAKNHQRTERFHQKWCTGIDQNTQLQSQNRYRLHKSERVQHDCCVNKSCRL